MVLLGSHQCRVSSHTAIAKTTFTSATSKLQICSLHLNSSVRTRQYEKELCKSSRSISTSYLHSTTSAFHQLRSERGYQRRGIAITAAHTSFARPPRQDEYSLSYTSDRNGKLQDDRLISFEKGEILTAKPTNKDEAATLSLAEEFRKAMRGVAYPVAVITNSPENTHPIQEKNGNITKEPAFEALQGLLASSFNTITMNPEPYISLNIKLPSRTWTTIERTGEFLVHVMWSSKVAQQFAPDQLRATSSRDLHTLSTTAALKEMEKGRLFGLQCKLTFYHPVADHMLVVGKVLNLLPQSSTSQGASGHEPLLWRNGTWHTARPLKSKP